MLVRRIYTTILIFTATLMALNTIDQKMFGWRIFYPNGQATNWTWALWISISLSIAPWIFIGWVAFVTWALRHTIGIPSEMAVPEPPKKPTPSNVIQFKSQRKPLQKRFNHPVP